METIIKQNEILKYDYRSYLLQAIDYSEYKMRMADNFNTTRDEKVKGYIQLNQRRMHRVEKTYTISQEVTNQLKSLKHKIYWLILTEHWCGDASQSLPVFNAIAEASNGIIEMKLLYRDQHSDLMDKYLTNGTKSIPKLIQLDKHFNVTGIWGPRPGIAQKLVKELRSNSESVSTYGNQLHLWYAKDKQKSLESEIVKLLFRANLFCPDCLS